MEENNQVPLGQTPESSQNQDQNRGQRKNTGMAIVAYILFFVPLLTGTKDDPFVKYHVKQGLTLFILAFIIGIISWMPLFYWISWILNLGVLALLVVGIMNAAAGKEKELPVIGQFAKNFHF